VLSKPTTRLKNFENMKTKKNINQEVGKKSSAAQKPWTQCMGREKLLQISKRKRYENAALKSGLKSSPDATYVGPGGEPHEIVRVYICCLILNDNI